MHWEKASSGAFADPPAWGELPEPVDGRLPPGSVDDGLPLHAAVSMARAAAAMMAAADSLGIGFMPAVLRPGG
jgi:hypothetical protein